MTTTTTTTTTPLNWRKMKTQAGYVASDRTGRTFWVEKHQNPAQWLLRVRWDRKDGLVDTYGAYSTMREAKEAAQGLVRDILPGYVFAKDVTVGMEVHDGTVIYVQIWPASASMSGKAPFVEYQVQTKPGYSYFQRVGLDTFVALKGYKPSPFGF